MPGPGVTLQSFHDRPAVHAGQMVVEDDGARAVKVGKMQARLTVPGEQRLEPHFSGQIAQDAGKMRVILDDEDGFLPRLEVGAVVHHVGLGHRLFLVGSGGGWRGGRFRSAVRAGLGLFSMIVALGQDQGEGRALVLAALQADLPAQELGQFAGDGQAQARAAVFAAGAAVGLPEGFENGALLFLGNADAHVLHGDADGLVCGCDAFGQIHIGAWPENGEGHCALVRELEGVREQVAQDLLQSVRVREQAARQVHSLFDLEGHAFVCGDALEDPLQIRDHRRDGHFRQMKFDLARLDLGEIQDLVDQPEEVRARGVDGRGRLLLACGEVAFLVVRQELGQDEDGVERGAQLMGHVGQEFGFVLAGDLQLPGLELELLLGPQELLVLFADGALLLFELLSPLAELVVDGAQLGLLILHPAFGFLQGAGLFGQLLVGDLQLFLLGLQFSLGFLEHLGLFFQFLVGHTQHLLLLLGLPQQVGDHAARGGHVEQHGRALHDLGDELSVQGGKGGFTAKEKSAEQFFAHEDRRGQEVGGDEFSGAEMKRRRVLVDVGEGEDLAFQRGLADQTLAHAQPGELAAAVGEGVG